DRTRRAPSRSWARLRLVELESRTLLSTASLDGLVKPAWQAVPAAYHNSSPAGYTPAQIRHAYAFDDIAFNNGTVLGDGSGQTIAIVVAYSHPNLEADLRVFDQTFGLPDADFRRVSQVKNNTPPRTDAGWGLEAAMDVQWAHAIAPGADILV